MKSNCQKTSGATNHGSRKMSDREEILKWVAEAQSRCDAATRSPWVVGISVDVDWPVMRLRDMETGSLEEAEANATFVEHARIDLPRALKIIREELAKR